MDIISFYLTDRSTGTDSVLSLESLVGEEHRASLFSFSNSALLSARRSKVCLKSIPRIGGLCCCCCCCCC